MSKKCKCQKKCPCTPCVTQTRKSPLSIPDNTQSGRVGAQSSSGFSIPLSYSGLTSLGNLGLGPGNSVFVSPSYF
jgi:hypothetical protein